MKQLLLLHGALGAKQQLEPLKQALGQHAEVHTLNFEGHGGRSSEQPFSIELFAENVHNYLLQNNLLGCAVFGYSMGGYVALKLQSMQPGSFSQLITLGTKFNWSPEIAQQETALLNPEKIEEKVPRFAAALAALHAPLDWKEMMRKTAGLMHDLGANPALTTGDLEAITAPVSLLLGSEDTMVSREETEAVFHRLPQATFTVIDGWQHPIERIDATALAAQLTDLML